MPPSRMMALLGTWRADCGWRTVSFILACMLGRSLFVEPCLQLPECSCRNHLCDHSAIHCPAVDTGDTSIDLLGLILSSGAIRMSKILPKGRFTVHGEELQEQFDIPHTVIQIESDSTLLPCLQTACDN